MLNLKNDIHTLKSRDVSLNEEKVAQLEEKLAKVYEIATVPEAEQIGFYNINEE